MLDPEHLLALTLQLAELAESLKGSQMLHDLALAASDQLHQPTSTPALQEPQQLECIGHTCAGAATATLQKPGLGEPLGMNRPSSKPKEQGLVPVSE